MIMRKSDSVSKATIIDLDRSCHAGLKAVTVIACFVLSFLPRLVHAEFRALIVGIDNYQEQNTEFGHLHGTKDAEKFANLLNAYWGHGSEKLTIHTVKDHEATTSKIKDEFTNWLIKDAKPTDTLVFYFSGHGTLVPAELTTKVRSAIVPIDVRMNPNAPGLDESHLITGKFFRDQMQMMRSTLHLKNFTMVVDACESAAIARGIGGAVSKRIENDAVGTEPSMTPPSDDPLFNADNQTNDFVIISAARTDRSAWEGPDGGNLTVSLAKAIHTFYGEQSNGGRIMTYAELQDRMLAELANLPQCGQPQQPSIVGHLDRQLFGTKEVSGDPYYQVSVDYSAGASKPVVHIGAGQLFGIDANATFAIYEPGTQNFESAKPIAHASVTASETYECTVKLTDFHGGDFKLLKGARAKVISGVQDAFVNLDMSAVKGNPDYDALWENLHSRPLIRNSDQAAKDAFLIPPGVTPKGIGRVTSSSDWTLLDKQGNPRIIPKGADVKELADNIDEAVRDMARYKAVIGIQAPNPSIRLEIEAIPVSYKPDPRNRGKIIVTSLGTGKIANMAIPSTDKFTFRVRATGPDGNPLRSIDQFLLITILDCEPDGNVSALWPTTGISSEDTKLLADGNWRYLSIGGQLIDAKSPESVMAWNLAPSQGSGQEVFKAMGTDQSVSYKPLLSKSRETPRGIAQNTVLGDVLNSFRIGLPVSRAVADTPAPSSFSVAVSVLMLQATEVKK
jgi:hypothetical protein